jgi:regulator of sigma E protease
LTFAASDASWTTGVLNVLLVLVGLNLVILVHELGHFVVARLCGVKCEKFYVWFDIFGWKLFKFKWGETEYGLGVLPLGGYVKMLGQEDNPARLKEEIDRAKAQAPNPSESLKQQIVSAELALYDPNSYLAKSIPKRMAIISAGVIMNVVFAFVAAAAAYGLGVKHIACVVGEVFPGESAWQANVRVGDEVEQIAGRRTERFTDLQRSISVGDIDDGVGMVIRRIDSDGKPRRLDIDLEPDRMRIIPTIGVGNCSIPTLRAAPALPGSRAALAHPGFEAGDRFVRIDGVPIDRYAQVYAQLARKPDKPLHITVERTIQPPESDPNAAPTTEEKTIEVAPAHMRHLGLIMQMGPITAIQNDSPAADADIRKGDRIVAINGQPADDEPPLNPMTLPERLRKMAEKGTSQITLALAREGEKRPVEVTVGLRQAERYWAAFDATSPMTVPALGIAYRVLPRVEGVEQGGPAAKAGLKRGDVVVRATLIPPDNKSLTQKDLGVKVDDVEQSKLTVHFDEPEVDWPIVHAGLQKLLPGTKVELELKGGRTVTLTPVEAAEWFNPERGFLFEPLDFTQTAGSFGEALSLGLRETGDSLTLIFRVLRSLGTGQVPLKALSGPVGIATVAFDYASRGLSALLIFLCLLSANLAVLNFLPIPVLDGGHMIFLAYEGIRGKPPSETVLTTLTFAGLIMLLGLMIWVTGLDIFRLFGR